MKRVLPRERDDLPGMRAARWFCESTMGQWGNLGPDAQRERQERAIHQHAGVDIERVWMVVELPPFPEMQELPAE